MTSAPRLPAAPSDRFLDVERRLRAALVALLDAQGGGPDLQLAGLRAVLRLCRSAESSVETAMVRVETAIDHGEASDS